MKRSRNHLFVYPVLAATVLLAACDTDSSRPAEAVSPDYTSVSRGESSSLLVSRANEYHSLEELTEGSELVAVVTPTDSVRPDRRNDEGMALANVDVKVEAVLQGSTSGGSDVIQVFAEGFRNEDGSLGQNKFEVGQRYLMYLTDMSETDDVYAVTGYLAGLYEEVAPGKFGRVDAESPDLPVGIEISDGVAVAVK